MLDIFLAQKPIHRFMTPDLPRQEARGRKLRTIGRVGEEFGLEAQASVFYVGSAAFASRSFEEVAGV